LKEPSFSTLVDLGGKACTHAVRSPLNLLQLQPIISDSCY